MVVINSGLLLIAIGSYKHDIFHKFISRTLKLVRGFQ